MNAHTNMRVVKRRLDAAALLLLGAVWSVVATSAAAAPPSVYYSVVDDGVDPGTSVEIPVVPATVHLYLDGGAIASSAAPCQAGDGDEVCGWKLHLEGQNGLDLVSFTPTGDVVFGLSGNTLLATGGEPGAGTLGPAKIGDLVVDGVPEGELLLLVSDSVSASQTLVSISSETLAFVPEPAGSAMLGAGAALLIVLARRRPRR